MAEEKKEEKPKEEEKEKPEEKAPRREVKETAKEMEEVAKTLAKGLKEVGRLVASEKIPRLARNTVMLATSALVIYIISYSVSSMIPYLAQGLTQIGVIMGYAIPLMFMFMLFSIFIGIARLVL
ncbi:MAG: hypothetical protein QW503_02315 [Sulfolobales archaeon]